MEKDIQKREPEYEKVMNNGHALLDASEPGLERNDLGSKLVESEKRWNDVKTTAEKRSNGIDVILPESQKYSDNSVTFSCWLMTAETKEKDLSGRELPFDKTRLDQYGQEVEVRQILIMPSVFY